MLLSIETSALNRIAKRNDGLERVRQVLADEGLRPAIGTHTIYELAKLLWDPRNAAIRRRLFQLVLDLDPAFLVPADRLLECELRRLQRGEAVVPFLMGPDLAITKRIVTRLAAGESDDEAVAFTRRREGEIDRSRREDQQNVDRLVEARREGHLPAFKTFEELVEYFRDDVPNLIRRRFKDRIDIVDARRFAARLDEFPVVRTVVRADLHFMFIRAVQGQVPSRDKTADYRHVIDASYCHGILVDDGKLFRKVPVLNPHLRAVPWPRDDGATYIAGAQSCRPSVDVSNGSRERGGKRVNNSRETAPRIVECIYCRSTVPPTKREHVMSQALGTFQQNWTLDCVCDECNKYFADTLELALGRDSREALLRIELGLKSAAGASELLNRRIRTTLQDPGLFNGIRVRLTPSHDGSDVVPVPVPQVGFRREGEEWYFLTENELTRDNLRPFSGASPVEIRIHGVGAECDRLRERLAQLGIEFAETHRVLDQPVTEQPSIAVLYDINNDQTIVRAACKIGFNYAAKVLGCEVVRQPRFDAARRFIRYGEAPVQIATARQGSVLVGPDAASARIHACGIGWNHGYLCVVVSLFNELTYGLRLCESHEREFTATQHFFDPLARTISEAPVAT